MSHVITSYSIHYTKLYDGTFNAFDLPDGLRKSIEHGETNPFGVNDGEKHVPVRKRAGRPVRLLPCALVDPGHFRFFAAFRIYRVKPVLSGNDDLVIVRPVGLVRRQAFVTDPERTASDRRYLSDGAALEEISDPLCISYNFV